jgi:large subunit ribosomal protein L19
MITANFLVLPNKLMKTIELIQKIENYQIKKDLPTIEVGDIARIGIIIQEGNKQRVQPYEGTVIAKANTGINKAVTIRRVFQGISIERIFLLHSPSIQNIEIIRKSKVRRAKLYYLRDCVGKNARLVQRFQKN